MWATFSLLLRDFIKQFWSTTFITRYLLYIRNRTNFSFSCSFYLSHKNFPSCCFPLKKIYDLYWVEIFFIPPQFFPRLPSFPHLLAMSKREKAECACEICKKSLMHFEACQEEKLVSHVCKFIEIERMINSHEILRNYCIFFCISSRVVVVVVAAAVCEICENIEIMMTTHTTFFERENRFRLSNYVEGLKEHCACINND